MKVYLLIEGDRHEGEQIFSVHATRASATKEIVVLLNEFIADLIANDLQPETTKATTRNWREVADQLEMAFEIQAHELTARK